MKTILKKVVVTILELEARILLYRCKPKIIAVAGSVGKTSTKDAIYCAINSQNLVRRNEKSFNSEFGIPLTILDLPTGWGSPLTWLHILWRGFFRSLLYPKNSYPKILILEAGTDRPGDMDRIVKWLPIDVAVLTRCPEIPVHVEYFDNAHSLNEEDKKIVKGLKSDGVAILNIDDSEIMQLQDRYNGKIITYGYSNDADVKADDYKELLGRFIGKQHGYPVLAAIAVANALKLDTKKSLDNLMNYDTPKGRMKLILGRSGTQILDDTYNSSPVAVEEALNVLSTRNTNGRRVAVLGDMLELGKFTVREHKRLGAYAKDKVDVLVTVGMRAEDFAHGAREAHMHHTKVHVFADAVEAINYLEKHIHEGDTILVKGSQGARMERIVKALMAEPDKAGELLVRQEKEWESL